MYKLMITLVISLLTCNAFCSHGRYGCGHYNCHGKMCSSRGVRSHVSGYKPHRTTHSKGMLIGTTDIHTMYGMPNTRTMTGMVKINRPTKKTNVKSFYFISKKKTPKCKVYCFLNDGVSYPNN